MTTISCLMTPPSAADPRFDDISSELPAALNGGQMHLYFQPVVSLADRSATTLEALPRWDHPSHGVIGPASFIEPVRQAGLLVELERWAIVEAIHQLGNWSRGVAGQLSISVNLSSGHALSDRLGQIVRETAAATGVSIGRLGIEIQESALSATSPADMQSLRMLSDIGINFTVDGFSGALDAESLRNLQISAVKIARHVIAKIPDDEEQMAIVERAIALGRQLGIGVIATGIESPGQAGALRNSGCRYGQGFLFSVPMPAEVLEEHMLNH